MIMMTRIVWELAMVLCGTTLAGQGRLQFVDAVTGEPVPYVHVIYGDHEGKYADESGNVTIPDGVLTARTSHISYESMELDLEAAGEASIRLTPVVTELQPAIIVPKNLRKRTIGYAAAKVDSGQGGRNGFSLAEYFNLPDRNEHTALVSAVTLNLNTVNLKRKITARVDGEEYTDGVMHVAKLRVDLRDIDPATGAPGRSLIDGGVIYTIKDNFNLNLHNKCRVPLSQPAVFPEDGLFVVVEWIVTDDIRVQDSVSPDIWCTRAENGSSSWVKWPVGTEWRPREKSPFDEYEKTFCISLDLLQ